MRNRLNRSHRLALAIGGAVALVGVLSLGASATHSFLDVPEDHIFHGDIEWMKDADVTRGCNPPANTEYCPEEFTTRGQMAAFFHRFSNSGVLNAGTLDGKDSTEFLGVDGKAADSDLLDGIDSTEFVQKTELEELTQFPTGSVTVREADESTGLIVAGNTYTTACEPGEVAIGGGYESDFVLVGPLVDGLDTGALETALDLVGLGSLLPELGGTLDGVSNLDVHTSRPTATADGWTIGTTINVASGITVYAVCAG